MDCFRKVIKNADQIIKDSKNLYLFANLLNKYLYYFSIDADFVSISLSLYFLDNFRWHQ